MPDWIVNQAGNKCEFVISTPAGVEIIGLGNAFTVQISKNGGAFAIGAGVKSEIGLGWYKYIPTAGESDTLGTTVVVVTAAGAQQQNLIYDVISVAVIPTTVPLTPLAAGSAFASYLDYSAFWCMASLHAGVDVGGAIFPATNAYLTDPTQTFLTHGARANVGMILYNLTRGTSGLITAASETTLTAPGVTWSDGDAYRVIFVNAAQRANIEHYLNVTSGDIHAALGAAGASNCTRSSWGSAFLAEINIIVARLFHECPCAANLSSDEKSRYAEIVRDRLTQIRSGEVDVCSGETGSLFPAVGWAEHSHTEWNAARIIINARE